MSCSASSRNWGDKIESYTADVAQETWSKNASFQQTFKEVTSDTFSSSQAVTDTLRRFENEGQRWEQRADFARTQGASMERTYAQEFITFAEGRLLGGRDAYGVEVDRQRLGEILNPRTADDRALLEETAQSFFQTKASQIEAPSVLGETRELPSSLRELTQFDGNDLRAGHAAARGGLSAEMGQVDDQITPPRSGTRLKIPQEGRSDVQASTAEAGALLEREADLEGKLVRNPADVRNRAAALEAADAGSGDRRP